MSIIRIKDLSLRIIIGINPDERIKKQDVIINVEVEVDTTEAASSDNIEHTFDYKTLTKRIIAEVEPSEYYLIEKLADHILNIVLDHDRTICATVEVDKPAALRYASSVSIEVYGEREA